MHYIQTSFLAVYLNFYFTKKMGTIRRQLPQTPSMTYTGTPHFIVLHFNVLYRRLHFFTN